MNRCQSERYLPLRQSDVFYCIGRGDRNPERRRVGQADVLGRGDHQSPGDEARILPALEHLRQPVDRRVRVGAANALVNAEMVA